MRSIQKRGFLLQSGGIMEFDIKEELKKLPEKPGVYLMHDADDTIIYVGKAVSLKNRVRQYFQSSRDKTKKIQTMVSKIARFEYIITDSELEALVLECNLIKEHMPKYNTMLKDGKAYPYICVTVGEEYPRVSMVHKKKKDKSRYFGPYTSRMAVNDTLELLHKLFQIRTCNRVLPRDIGKERPCLNYHIKQCSAPCQGYISKEEYQKQIQLVLDFLNGTYTGIQKELEEKMRQASQEMRFEEAIQYRELLHSLKHVVQKQKITEISSAEDRDVIAFAVDGTDAVVQVFFVREGKMIGRDHFHLVVAQGDSNSAIMSSFVKQFYAGTPFLPSELYLQYPLEDETLVQQWLSQKKGKKVTIKVPQRGEKERLVELAQKNAKLVLTQDTEKIKREEIRTRGAVRQIEEWLGIAPLSRMEAYDISNTNGFQSVGSMVVYEDGRPKKSDYRKFRIKWVQGANDYASMNELLQRRFTHGAQSEEMDSFQRFPDLILMDGGRGQVNIAEQVLAELGYEIPVCGMVKDEHHRTRGLYYKNQEIPIDRHSEGFQLITRIQDEAHRFAIEYHRSLRGKESTHSILDDIEGIGVKRCGALMRTYENIAQMKAASVEELENIPEMNHRAAQAVYDFFHAGE